MKETNVLFVGLGPLGRMIAGDFLARRLGRVWGAADPAPEIAGHRLSELVPAASGGLDGSLVVARSIDEAFERPARPGLGELSCAVVATSSSLRAILPTLRALAERGVSVVSTCEELLNPWFTDIGAARELEALCTRHGVRMVGTGVNPGFLMDTFPVALTAICKTVRRVTVERYQDASPRRLPFQQKIGAGLSDKEFERKVADKSLRHVGLGESLHFINHYLSLGVTRWDETLEPVRAERDLTSGLGPIKRGGISGVKQTASGYTASGERVVFLDFQAAIGQRDPRDRVVIDADPPLDVTIKGGVHGDVATSAITLNTIASLLAAPPGLHTMASLPVTHYRRGG